MLVEKAGGSIWPEIERYARMRMTPGEIQLALELEGRSVHSYAKVENALRKAWERGILERRTPDERKRTHVDPLHQSDGELKERIYFWLRTERQLKKSGQTELPQTRADWLDSINMSVSESLSYLFPDSGLIPVDNNCRLFLIRYYDARNHWHLTGDRSLIDNLPIYYEQQDPEIIQKLAKQISIIREKTPMRTNWDRAKLESAMATHGELDKN